MRWACEYNVADDSGDDTAFGKVPLTSRACLQWSVLSCFECLTISLMHPISLVRQGSCNSAWPVCDDCFRRPLACTYEAVDCNPSTMDIALPPLRTAAMVMPPISPLPSPVTSEQGHNDWNSPAEPAFSVQQHVQRHASPSPSASEISFTASSSRMSSPGRSESSEYSFGSDSSRKSSRGRPLQRSPYAHHSTRRPRGADMSSSTRAAVDGMFLDFLVRLCSDRKYCHPLVPTQEHVPAIVSFLPVLNG
jgi:hypothetical protein